MLSYPIHLTLALSNGDSVNACVTSRVEMRREKTRTVFRMIVLLLLAVISMVAMSQDMSCTRSNAYELALLKEQCLVEFAPIVVDKATPGDELMDEDADDDEEELGLDSKVDFASEAAGGKIVASSKGMEMPGNILKSNLDKYLMVPCEEPVKHVSAPTVLMYLLIL